MASKNIHSSMSDLYQTLKDSRNGYKECADKVAEEIAKLKFHDLANKRQQMMQELKQTAATKGEDIEEKGSLTAAAHRIFVDIKSLFTKGDKKAIINEIERGEDYLIDCYEKVLAEETLPEDIASLLEKQVQEIQHDLASVKESYISK